VASADKSSSKAAAPAEKKAGKPWLLIFGIVVLLAGGGGAATWFLSKPANAHAAEGAAADAKPAGGVPAPAQYVALEPAFVVNLEGGGGVSRYLQVEVQLMTRDATAAKDLETHAPAIRAGLLMLFSQQQAESLGSRAGKEKLQAVALAEVNRLLKAETGTPKAAEALMFTSFVMQ
jgi:flagellar FliL protein